jgi:DNA-binding GntR family transcriptional regulator
MTVGQAHQSLRDAVVDELRRLILSGEFPAGARLKEAAAAERLGVSRLPVREAFRRLEAEGLLVSQPRRGVVVTPPSDDELTVVHSIRMALELLAVESAAQRQEPEAMAQLAEALRLGRAAAAGRDEATLADLNSRFHETLTAGCGSTYLAGLLRSVRNQVHHLVGGWHSSPGDSWGEHSEILQAVLDGDAPQAVDLMRTHLRNRHEAAVGGAPA